MISSIPCSDLFHSCRMLPCGTLLVILIALTCVMMAPTSLHKDDWTSPLTSYDLEKIYTQLATIPILCDDPQSTELYAKVLKDVSDVQESILDNWCDRCFQQSIDASYLLPGVHLQGDPLSIFNYKPLPKPSQPYIRRTPSSPLLQRRRYACCQSILNMSLNFSATI